MNPEDKLPCDVMLPPSTIIRKGCRVETLLIAIKAREGLPDNMARILIPGSDYLEPRTRFSVPIIPIS